ncbi:Eukaryotic LigT isoform 4 [Theobroma cacao]|nr:Eukaryotic LigT isoform 4 [Theobroma cacao]
MDKKKRKIGTPVWKPVCTQPSSLEEHAIKDVMVESENGSEMQEVNEVTNATVSPKALEDDIEDGALKEEPVLSDEKHSLSVEIGASLIRFVRGKEGSTKEKIEKEMGVQIILPSSKQEDSIMIEGTSADSVTKASKEIQHIIDEAVKTPILDYSHFVSLPLAIHPELVDKLVDFQNSILGISDACVDDNQEDNSDGDTSEDEAQEQQSGKGPAMAVEVKVSDDKKSVKVDVSSIPFVSYVPKESKSSNLSDLGIEKSIFIKPKTFHLTVLMLKLWNKERVNLAAEVLKSISSKVMDALDNRPIFVRLKGLNCMRGSLARARVVYAPVEEIGSENRLLCACEVIINAFVEAGLVLEKDARHELKLHATVMNARHRKRKGKRGKFDSFDARGIFKQFGSEEWGEYLIREAHLSQRFKFDEYGYYHCCASIPFPENMQVD